MNCLHKQKYEVHPAGGAGGGEGQPGRMPVECDDNVQFGRRADGISPPTASPQEARELWRA
jgi:hypothetical protein